MAKFRKKPVVIEAVKLEQTMSSIQSVMEFMGEYKWSESKIAQERYYDYLCDVMKEDGLSIYTLEGKMLASWGDWVIKGVNGEFYPIKEEIFLKTYEPVEQ